MGLSEYVFCDHFGFVYAFALEECDRVVAAQTIGSAPPGTSSSLPASISASSPDRMTNQFPTSCSQRVAFFSARSISASMLGVIRLISSINNASRAHTRHRSTEVARLLAVIWRLFSHCWTLHSIHHGMSHVAVDLCTACVYSCSIETTISTTPIQCVTS